MIGTDGGTGSEEWAWGSDAYKRYPPEPGTQEKVDRSWRSICERNYKITTLHCLSYSSGHHEGPRNLYTKDYTFLTSLQKTSKSQCQPVTVIRCRMKITLSCHSLVDFTPSMYRDLWEISLSNGDSISWHKEISIKTNFNHTIPIFPLQDASLPATQEVPTFPQHRLILPRMVLRIGMWDLWRPQPSVEEHTVGALWKRDCFFFYE